MHDFFLKTRPNVAVGIAKMIEIDGQLLQTAMKRLKIGQEAVVVSPKEGAHAIIP
jgi:hypothetical protein